MKIRKGRDRQDKIELQMTPMIDIVFQLLVFFIMTFKIVAQEGDFNIRMPATGAPTTVTQVNTPPLRVRMKSNAEGTLTSLSLDGSILAPAPGESSVFDTLHRHVREQIGDPGGPPAETAEVEFECDYDLRYEYVIAAITAVSGYKVGDGPNQQIIKLIEKIKFAPPKKAAT